MAVRLTSAGIARKIKELSKPQEGLKYVINRNPRNLEKLRIAYKPDGYHLDRPGRCFWYKLELKPSAKYLTAEVRHFRDGPIITASTNEWAIKKQLFKTNDTSAYVNLARVLAQRCEQIGLKEMECNIEAVPNSKTEKFLQVLEENGIILKEPDRFLPHRPWSFDRPEKPWDTE